LGGKTPPDLFYRRQLYPDTPTRLFDEANMLSMHRIIRFPKILA